MTHTVISGQSVADVALIVYGSVEGVHRLMQDNPGLSIDARLHGGQQLAIRQAPINPRMSRYLADWGLLATIDKEDQPQGIGHYRLDEYTVQ